MDKPTTDELSSRIRRQGAAGRMEALDSACWRRYLAALVEWALITPNEHADLLALLPECDPDPSLPILLGPEEYGG